MGRFTSSTRPLRPLAGSHAPLQQLQVLGSAQESTLTEAVLDGLQLEVEAPSPGAPPTPMGVHLGALGDDDKTFDIGTEGEVLALLDANDLASFILAGLSDRR